MRGKDTPCALRSNSQLEARVAQKTRASLLQAASSERRVTDYNLDKCWMISSQPVINGASFKPCAASSEQLEPLYNRIESLESLSLSFCIERGAAETKMNVFFGWRIWNPIWCGDSLTKLVCVTFNSIVANVPFFLYKTISGKPDIVANSIRFKIKWGLSFSLTFCQNLLSCLGIF